MNILICRWDIFVYPDILDTMKNEGHLCDVLDFSAIKMSDEDIASFSKVLEDKLCEKNSDFYIANLSADNSPLKNLSPLPLSEKTSDKETKYDAVFSVNFFSYIAEVCHRHNIRYICYNVDSPLLNMQHPSVNYKTNCIYTFDSSEAKHFNNNGTDTVHYLPLCTNTKRVQALIENSHHISDLTDNDFIKSKLPEQTAYENVTIKNTNLKQTENYTVTKSEYTKSYKYKYDISFVGNLYDKNRYDEMERDKAKIMAAQTEGTYKARRLVYVAKADFGPRPAQGVVLTLDGKAYKVKTCTEEAGVLAIELEAVRS